MTKINIILFICFFLLQSFAFCGVNDSLYIENLSKKELKEPETQKLIYTYADSLANISKEREALVYYNKVIPFLKEDSTLAMVLNSRNTCYMYLSEYNKIIENSEIPLKYFESINDTSLLSNVYSVVGLAYLKLGILDSANMFFFKALPLVESDKFLQEKSDVYYNIASVFRELKDYNKAQKYLLKSAKISLQLGDSVYYSSGLSGVGTIYYLEKKYDSALFYYQKAYDILQKSGKNYGLGSLYDGLGRVYFEFGNNKKAKVFLLKGYIFNIKRGYKSVAAKNLSNLSAVYYTEKKYDSAFFYIKEALRLNRQVNIKLSVRDNLKTISVYYYKIEDYKKAYHYRMKYEHLQDSIINESITRKIANYRSKYETEKKDNEIIVQKLKIEVQQAELDKQETIKNQYLFLVVLISLVFVLAILYWKKLQKMRIRQIEQQNMVKIQEASLKTQRTERKRVANILHDNLAHVIINSQTQVSKIISKTDNKEAKQKLIQLEENLEFMNKLAKVASYELEFSFVLDKNLVDQFAGYIARVEHSHSPKIIFNYSDKTEFDTLTDEIKINLFSVFQEMLGNAIKYAKAKTITVSLYRDKGKTILQVDDDGTGFNYDEVRHGQGFINMKERAEKLNGKFTFESEIGFGTKLKFEV